NEACTILMCVLNLKKDYGMPTKKSKHKWEFTSFLKSGIYKWNGSALASRHFNSAINEIWDVSEHDSATAAKGAVIFIEKCYRAIKNIDSSNGAIGGAVNNALTELTTIIAQAELSPDERMELTEKIWATWRCEGYGYYDILGELWPKMCAVKEVLNYWADKFLPVTKQTLTSTDTGLDDYDDEEEEDDDEEDETEEKDDDLEGKGSRICFACLFEAGRYDEILDLLRISTRNYFDYKKYEIKVIAAKGDIDQAIKMLDECMKNSYVSPYQAAYLGENLLLSNGRIEEAYQRYAFNMPFSRTGLATFSSICKKYPQISPQRILKDLIDYDEGNEKRYFAAARKIGMIDLAIEIAEKYDVEPKTLTTACKDYIAKEPNLSLQFGLMALERYANGFGYEPEFGDIRKCYELILIAAQKAGKEKEIAEQIKFFVDNDNSKNHILTLAVNFEAKYNII
ncbi:MAG: hypothetical protein Q4F84_04585, partial [Fibrobacter sp.]|nr:hypothetical protein [Fibrobacter sp.]